MPSHSAFRAASITRAALARTVLYTALVAAPLLSGCAKQGEGERCDPNSGNLDCDTGLACRSADQLSIGVASRAGLCCPVDENAPTVNACRAGADLPNDQDPPATPIVDAGESDSGT